MSSEQAKQKIKFVNIYRSYVINYNLGKDIVKNYIERHGGTSENPEKKWELFRYLLTTPQTPSGLNK
jgi:5'(3')-deoxyribonucleotidase